MYIDFGGDDEQIIYVIYSRPCSFMFEFYRLYEVFLPLFRSHREYFYDNCGIGSVYGAPADCLWGGGRVGFGDAAPADNAEAAEAPEKKKPGRPKNSDKK